MKDLVVPGACFLCLLLSLSPHLPAWSQKFSIPEGYPESLRQQRDDYTAALIEDLNNPQLWKQLSHVYMNLADDLLTDTSEKIEAYDKGLKAATQAMTLHPDDAETHFLYAANLGSATRLRGITSGVVNLSEVMKHVDRAVELDPHHAPSLQMKGGLLAELPWYLGGNTALSKDYLHRAIEADDKYTNARIILAKLLIKEGKFEEARAQLLAVIQVRNPHYPYTWERRFRPEAQRLLDKLQDRR